MDRFNLMAVYVAVAEAASFAGGARKLSMSPPAVTRAVAALEEHLGVKLLNRTTRYVRVTDAGLRYLEDARRILAELDEADESAAGINAAPRGHLVVTAPVLFGRMFVTPSIVDYLTANPEVSVSAIFLDHVVNLLEEGIDVGVRIGELPDSTMHAAKVGYVRRILCAAPVYLAKNGLPQTPEDLAQHTIIAASGVSPHVEWEFLYQGKKYTHKVMPRFTTTSNDAAIEAATRGFGITRLLSYQAAPYLSSGTLKIVLSDYETPRLPIHILHRENRYASAKIRSFVNMLSEYLRAHQSLYSSDKAN